MVTLQTADGALKSFYLDAVTDALDKKANPFLAQIERTTADVVGKDVRKLVRIGMNGGIGAGSETGDLPNAAPNEYTVFVSGLKNLYGKIEISDKALRASSKNEGAFVNLLNDEMHSLVQSASFNFGRMLFGDGSGRLARVTSVDDDNTITVDNVKGFTEGLVVDFYTVSGTLVAAAQGRRIVSVDRQAKQIVIDGDDVTSTMLPAGVGIYVQSSKNYEITGLASIFSESPIYGSARDSSVLIPYVSKGVGEISESVIQKAIDTIEENSGSKINFILCSWGVRRALVEHFKEYKVMLPTTNLEGGFTGISFNGIPVIADRFCPDGTMYLLNTDDFKLHQLCDWQWLEGEDGKILKQVPGKPVYTATLVKYAELMCYRPCGQGMLSGITEK